MLIVPSNPFDVRDLLIDDPSPWVRDCAIRAMLARGWTVERIVAEIPTIAEGHVRAIAAGLAKAN